MVEATAPAMALSTYFANVGQRWDSEWLELGRPFDEAADADDVYEARKT